MENFDVIELRKDLIELSKKYNLEFVNVEKNNFINEVPKKESGHRIEFQLNGWFEVNIKLKGYDKRIKPGVLK